MRWSALSLGLVLASCGAEDARLIDPAKIVDDTFPVALTDESGDVLRGQTVFSDREGGHCVLCHVIADLDVPFQGNLGPDLSSVADRLTPAQLRLRIADYQIVRPGTVMPSYYRIADLHQVAEPYREAPILSAQDIEDLVAYLGEQKSDHGND